MYGSVRGAISDGRPYRDNYPETGLEEINGDLPEADFWPVTRVQFHDAAVQRPQQKGMCYELKLS